MENAVQSLQQATTALSEIHQTVDVGNAVVNGILERALEQVQNQGISLDFDVWVSDAAAHQRGGSVHHYGQYH